MIDYVPTIRASDSDLGLIRVMANGDTRALDELYARYGSGIFSFLVARLGEPALAEEVLQDVMLAAWRSAAQFRGESKVLTWLLTIARNRSINVIRKRRLPLVPINDALDTGADDTGPLEKVMRHTEQQAVRDALDQLPAAHREVLILVFYHHLTAPEVAAVLGIAIGTVKSRLHRAKDALRDVLRHEGRVF